MNREEVLETLCAIVALVYRSVDDYSEPSDGFCRKCPAQTDAGWNFQHSGRTLEFVRAAVVEKLNREGIPLHAWWDANGRPVDVGELQ